MNDLISRQAAIDALERTKEKDPKGDIASFYNTITDNKIAVIEALPSVHPEHDCDTCRYNHLEWDEEPCDGCTVGGESCHWKPSAQQWIPCSERLPDIHDEVLVTARGEVSIAWLYVDGKWRSNDMPQPMFGDIIAWMPLPEPYKGEQE